MTIGRRLYRLRPWLIRATVPARRPGSYVLYSAGECGLAARYNGRSDHDVARRLASHARAGRGDYFTYNVHHSPETAYLAECAAFHLRDPRALNLIHPAAPRDTALTCPFCRIRGVARRSNLIKPVVSEPMPATATSTED